MDTQLSRLRGSVTRTGIPHRSTYRTNASAFPAVPESDSARNPSPASTNGAAHSGRTSVPAPPHRASPAPPNATAHQPSIIRLDIPASK